jgi:hypothetical protein
VTNDYPGGLRPDSASDFYLLAILTELRALRAALEAPKPAPATRKTPASRR